MLVNAFLRACWRPITWRGKTEGCGLVRVLAIAVVVVVLPIRRQAIGSTTEGPAIATARSEGLVVAGYPTEIQEIADPWVPTTS